MGWPSTRHSAEIFQKRQRLRRSETLDRQVALLQEAVEVQEIVSVCGQSVRRAIARAEVPEESCNLRDQLLPVIQEIKRDAAILLPSANSHAPPSPLVHLFYDKLITSSSTHNRPHNKAQAGRTRLIGQELQFIRQKRPMLG